MVLISSCGFEVLYNALDTCLKGSHLVFSVGVCKLMMNSAFFFSISGSIIVSFLFNNFSFFFSSV